MLQINVNVATVARVQQELLELSRTLRKDLRISEANRLAVIADEMDDWVIKPKKVSYDDNV